MYFLVQDRDLHNALLCTVLQSQFLFEKLVNMLLFFANVCQILCTKSEEKQVEKQVRYRKIERNFAGILCTKSEEKQVEKQDLKCNTEK